MQLHKAAIVRQKIDFKIECESSSVSIGSPLDVLESAPCYMSQTIEPSRKGGERARISDDGCTQVVFVVHMFHCNVLDLNLLFVCFQNK